jgi:hypothetical protein
LNKATSDIFGAIVEYYDNNNPNYKIGEGGTDDYFNNLEGAPGSIIEIMCHAAYVN